MDLVIILPTIFWIVFAVIGLCLAGILLHFAWQDQKAVTPHPTLAVQRALVEKDILFAQTVLTSFALCLVLVIVVFILPVGTFARIVMFDTNIILIELVWVNACLVLVLARINANKELRKELLNGRTTANRSE